MDTTVICEIFFPQLPGECRRETMMEKVSLYGARARDSPLRDLAGTGLGCQQFSHPQILSILAQVLISARTIT